MEISKCEQCDKVIEGYTKDHVMQLMKQHNFKHEREEANAQSFIDNSYYDKKTDSIKEVE